MLILALDTSGPTAGVALYFDGVIRYEAVARNKMTHSESIMPLMEEAFIHTALTIDEVDCFAVTAGPGSFTGVRIGVATVKAMAHAKNKPCIAVDALTALAQGAALFGGVLCPIQDARAGQVYGAVFEGGSMKRLLADQPLKIEDFIKQAQEKADGRPLLFVGDGVPAHREKIEAILSGAQARFAPLELLYPRPAVIAALAAASVQDAVPYAELAPLYLRAPQAERQKNLEAQAHG